MRCVAVGIAVIVFGLTSAPVALAHDDVVGTSPSNGAQLTSAPHEVRIEFSPDASPRSGTASVTGPTGNTYQAGEASIEGTSLVIPIRPTTTLGRYTIDFRMVSADGHPVTGTLTFELVEQTTPATTPTPPTGAAPGSTADATEGAPMWPWVIVVGVVGLGTAGLLRTISRSQHD